MRKALAAPRDEADRLCRLLVRRREFCQRCGGVGTDTAHIIPRRYAATRCDLENLLFLCRTCHDIFDRHAGNRSVSRNMVTDSILGPGTYDRLQAKASAGFTKPLIAGAFWQSEAARLRKLARTQGVR